MRNSFSDCRYTRAQGHPRLVRALSAEYSPLFDRPIDAFTEITTTAGAYEALYGIIAAFIEEGDEVVVFEPHFDAYLDDTMLSGGKVIRVPLVAPSPGTLVLIHLTFSRVLCICQSLVSFVLLHPPAPRGCPAALK